MELYQQQQFDFFLQTATERFVMRLEERFRGPEPAIAAIRQDPEGDGVWLSQYVDAVFDDFLLSNVAGACFVLQRLAKRNVPKIIGSTVESTLIDLSKRLFAELLLGKTIERLEQDSGYQPV